MQVPVEPVEASPARTEASERETPDPLVNRTTKGAVLLVDDDVTLLRSVARVLRARGYDITTAATGEEAIQEVAGRRFDVVLSDISMPGMNGIQLLRRLRETDLLVPFVLITGEPAVGTAMQAIEYGAFRYLTKPLAPNDLTAVIDQAVRYHRMARMKARAAEILGETAAPGDRAGLEASFERAIEGLWIAYQPIVHAREKRVFGYEALLRSTDTSLPHPGAILDAAERLDQLDRLGRTIRDRAAIPISSAAEDALLFVNLHVEDLLDPTLSSPDSTLSQIASRVVLEITERAALERVGDVRPQDRKAAGNGLSHRGRRSRSRVRRADELRAARAGSRQARHVADPRCRQESRRNKRSCAR